MSLSSTGSHLDRLSGISRAAVVGAVGGKGGSAVGSPATSQAGIKGAVGHEVGLCFGSWRRSGNASQVEHLEVVNVGLNTRVSSYVDLQAGLLDVSRTRSVGKVHVFHED